MMEAGMPERGDNTSSSTLPAYRQPVSTTSTSQRLGSSIPMSPRGSRSNQQPSDQNTIAVTAIAQNMITGKPVALVGAHLTPSMVKKFVDNVNAQLRTNTFHNSQLETVIDEKAWGTIKMKVANSRTLRNHPAQDWRSEWNVAQQGLS